MNDRKGKKKRPYYMIPLLVVLGGCASNVSASQFVLGLALAFAAFGVSCTGAPKDRDDLEMMTVERFENWRDRVSAVHEEAAYALVSHSEANVATVDHVLAAYAALASQPMPPGAVKELAGDYSGLLRIAILELGAVVGSDERGVTPRVKDLIGACAAGLVAGKGRALAEARASPPPDPETGP